MNIMKKTKTTQRTKQLSNFDGYGKRMAPNTHTKSPRKKNAQHFWNKL